MEKGIADFFNQCFTMNNWKELEAKAIEWAKTMGEIQLSYFRKSQLSIKTKSNIFDIVTAADKACEQYFQDQLTIHYPDHDMLGEETGIHEKGSDYCWVIDPLDGTTNFSQGLPIFCVSIGLQYKKETIIGVVYAPYLNELYTTIKGEGAYRNGQKLKVSDKTELSRSVIATGFPYDHGTNPDNNSANIVHILPKVRGIRRMGSAAYDLCCVAAGNLGWLLGIKSNLGMFAAGILLVEEAQGKVISFRNNRGISIIAGNSDITLLLKENIR